MNIWDILELIVENRVEFLLIVGLLSSALIMARVIAGARKANKNRGDSITGPTSGRISKSTWVFIIITSLVMPALSFLAEKITEKRTQTKTEGTQLATPASNQANSTNSANTGEEDSPKVQKYLHRLQLTRERGDRLAEGVVLRKLGDTYEYLLDNSAEAREYYQQAIEVARKIGDKKNEAYAIGSIGDQFNRAKTFGKGRIYFQQALKIFGEIDEQRGIAWASGNLGHSYSGLKEFVKAERFFQRALALYRKIGNRREEATYLAVLGRLYFDREDYSAARTHLEQAIAIYQTEDRQTLVFVLMRYITALDKLDPQ